MTPPVDADLMRAGRVRLVDHGAIIPERYRPVYASTINVMTTLVSIITMPLMVMLYLA